MITQYHCRQACARQSEITFGPRRRELRSNCRFPDYWYDPLMAELESSAAKRIAILRGEIEEHNRRYYEEAAPTISDREYDRLYRELTELEERYPQLATADSPTHRVGGMP